MNQEKNNVLATLKRLVPGTIDIRPCDDLKNCMDNKMRSCNDIKNLCILCRDNDKIIGGISFLFNISGKNGIMIHRMGQEGNYAKWFEGKGIDDIMKNVEEDRKVKEITERTKFIRDERKEAEDSKTIDDFKKYVDQSDKDDCILLTRKNSNGEYDDLDKKLIDIAKEKEKKTGKKIKIIDESELDRKIHILGISSNELMKKLKFEADTINNSDVDRVHIFVMPVVKNNKSNKFKDGKDGKEYIGILIINSIEDDILGINETKDRWKNYFIEKYEGLSFIGTETLE